MSLRRSALCLVPALIGCWTLKPGDEVPDAGRVDVVDSAVVDAVASDVVDVVSLDAPDVVPTDVVPTDVVPTDVVPTDVVPTDVVPTDVVSLDVTDAGMDVRDVTDVGMDVRDVTDVGMDVRDVTDVGMDVRDVTDVGMDVRDVTDVGMDVVDVRAVDASLPTGVRPIWPPNLSTVTTRTPTLRWLMPVDNLELVICSTRACDAVLYSAMVSGESHAVTFNLPTNVVYWQLRVPGNTRLATPMWQFRVAGGSLTRPAAAFGVTQRDMNNDGLLDLAVGAPGPRNSAARGQAYVYLGPLREPVTPIDVQNPDQTNGRSMGTDLAWGNFNRDAWADLAVASFDSRSFPIGTVTIFQSGGTSFSSTTRTLTCPGCQPGDTFASRITTGDTDGDGYDDLFVASVAQQGRVVVWRGGQFGLPTSESLSIPNPLDADASFASSLAVVGDIDGDGYGDLVVGAPCEAGDAGVSDCTASSRGKLHIYWGGQWGRIAPVPFTVQGGINERLGREIVPAGDVDEDGFADFLVTGTNGASLATSGVVQLFYGGPRLSFLDGTGRVVTRTVSNSNYLGFSAAMADVNGDGRQDILAGAPGADLSLPTDRGAVLVWRQGLRGAFDSAPVTMLPSYGTQVGYRLASLGDIDGDGLGDIVTTAPAPLSGTTSAGIAMVWLGGSTDVMREPDRIFAGPGPNGWMGRGLAP